jgi:class 3 adenylate cyclase
VNDGPIAPGFDPHVDPHWTPARLAEAWGDELSRRSARQVRWLAPALLALGAAMLAFDLFIEGMGVLVAGRIVFVASGVLGVGLGVAQRPRDALRAIALGAMLMLVLTSAFAFGEGRRPESLLTIAFVILIVAPIGLGYTAGLAAVLGLGVCAVAPVGTTVGVYFNAVALPVAAVILRRLVDGLERGAFEDRLQLEWARERERRLLHELLPAPVADELLQRGRVVPRQVEATIVFVDIVGFSTAASRVSPEVLLTTLDGLFTAFDEVVRRHGLTKLKTLGDGYLFAGGLFHDGDPQVAATLHAALDLVEALPPGEFTVRVGVHIGTVIAGVIGTTRPQFDVWGDTVNVAARVEQLGEPGAVVVSEAVHAVRPPELASEDLGVRVAKHGLQLHLYRVRRPPAS